mmetsp:Transcript_17101/g.51133  ORF Transcript_17101/g.51133 Transcript_17101/m.51133 type:complete len:195 (-) Transcript_17101:82-666(-)|eukprot:CAMPEP_0177645870 /NCGR_PEP_ID=MMETSP0447-20121125/9476_1 /TAXON_ID=0 /ORGANISM="Stygamoeba regulata, Strain BSH-02190019" /LENGTH=194 /DNA_ID=CAMNT_0019148375 /DNA_START=161 /DNA_END=745 /DNA_ORIENTATION=+
MAKGKKSATKAAPKVTVPLIKRNSKRVTKAIAVCQKLHRERRAAGEAAVAQKNAAAKARSAAQTKAQGQVKSSRAIRTSVRFRRPKTLQLDRAPKYPRRSAPRRTKLDAYRIIKRPVTSETAIAKIEEPGSNTLVFIVDLQANKNQIKQAIHKLYDVKAAKVNTLIRPDGQKKAFVKLAPEYDVVELANKIGIV